MFFTRLRFRYAATAIAAGILATGWGGASSAAPAPPGLSRADLRWLDRVTFGLDSATVAAYQRLGREKFLDLQLHPADDPVALKSEIAALPLTQESAESQIQANRTEQLRINALTNEDEKQAARNVLNQSGNEAIYETTKRHLIRALESPSQLREQMTWFWMNHFSVFSGKANVRWELAEYEEQAIRAHALGKFSDLVLATVTSPAMLEYLDNAQSAVGKINENYARELMELHTLGVSGGPSGSAYTQQDVQELARVLTGAGVNLSGTAPRLPAAQQAMYIRRGLFEFNPVRHDFTPKTVLGQAITGKGFDEIENAITLLCRQPAAAKFISRKLATYFVGEDAPPAMVERMTRTFQRTDGSIASVLHDMFLDRDFLASLASPAPKVEKPPRRSSRSLLPPRSKNSKTRCSSWPPRCGSPMTARSSRTITRSSTGWPSSASRCTAA